MTFARPSLLAEPAGAGRPEPVATAPFRGLVALWIQITGTWCTLACAHCLNASGPGRPWLRPLAPARVREALTEAEALGVKEVYFTGGEPFLHGALLPLLARSLEVAPTTVLTSGTLVDEALADRLAALAGAARYSLEIRISLDHPEPATNDRIRGRGAWAAAVRAIRLLDARGLLPIVTATEIAPPGGSPAAGESHGRFRDLLRSLGVAKPRLKLLPVFPAGRLAGAATWGLTDEMLEGFDRSRLQCAETRAVAAGGIYACPILAGQPAARLADRRLADAFGPAPLGHPACVTCHVTGSTCRNA